MSKTNEETVVMSLSLSIVTWWYHCFMNYHDTWHSRPSSSSSNCDGQCVPAWCFNIGFCLSVWWWWWWQDLSPGSVEEAEEAEPDDEFKDAIEVRNFDCSSSEALLLPFLENSINNDNNNNKLYLYSTFHPNSSSKCLTNKHQIHQKEIRSKLKRLKASNVGYNKRLKVNISKQVVVSIQRIKSNCWKQEWKSGSWALF